MKNLGKWSNLLGKYINEDELVEDTERLIKENQKKRKEELKTVINANDNSMYSTPEEAELSRRIDIASRQTENTLAGHRVVAKEEADADFQRREKLTRLATERTNKQLAELGF